MALTETLNFSKDSRLYIFRDKDIFTFDDGSLPKGLQAESIFRKINGGLLISAIEEKEKFAVIVEVSQNWLPPENLKEISIREFFSQNSQEEGAKTARNKTLIQWNERMKFCPRCAASLVFDNFFTAKNCPNCKSQYFPQIEPCIIVAITKGEEILLARHAMRNTDFFTCIAGFIEAGESAEQAVLREIEEEVGLKVKNLSYCGSQGWPYPDQLMLAYRAEYLSGEIKIQKDEILEAKWFHKENLPVIAKSGSLAYKLIKNLI